MSLAFGSRFTFRMVSPPQRAGIEVPTQQTTMFGAIGKTVLRGDRQSGRISFQVAQDGFASQSLANTFVDSVVNSKGHVESLVVTGRTTCVAELIGATETRVVVGGGTTTGWHARMTLEFEEIAQP